MPIQFGGLIGTADGQTGTTLAITSLVNVPAGAMIVIDVGTDGTTSDVTASDDGGNTYPSEDIHEDPGQTTQFKRLRHANCAALAQNDVITIANIETGDERAANAYYFTGLDTTTPLDQANSLSGGGGGGLVADSGNIITTTADQLLLGGIVTAAPFADTHTEDANFTQIARAGDVVGSISNRVVNSAYRIVSATGTFSYEPQYDDATERTWRCGISSYKAAAAAAGGGLLRAMMQHDHFSGGLL